MPVPVRRVGVLCMSCVVTTSPLVNQGWSRGVKWRILQLAILPPVADFILMLQQLALISSWSHITRQP